MPLTNKCPVEPTERSRGLIMELFRALHHPYICPVLDLELCNGHALAVLPFISRGSLKDLIYKVYHTIPSALIGKTFAVLEARLHGATCVNRIDVTTTFIWFTRPFYIVSPMVWHAKLLTAIANESPRMIPNLAMDKECYKY